MDEMSRLMNELIRESPLKDIEFKTIMVMPGLLFQKPSRKSKSKDQLTYLENRMKLWHAGEIIELLKEAETIQKEYPIYHQPLRKYLKNLHVRRGRVISIVR